MEEEQKKKRNRPDHDGTHRKAFERNKRRLLVSETVCGICGRPVDKTLKYPDPMAPCIDHIIPIDRGGHPSDIENLQLAHWKCNRTKANKLISPLKDVDEENGSEQTKAGTAISNRDLPLSMDWSTYKAREQ